MSYELNLTQEECGEIVVLLAAHWRHGCASERLRLWLGEISDEAADEAVMLWGTTMDDPASPPPRPSAPCRTIEAAMAAEEEAMDAAAEGKPRLRSVE